MNYYNPYFGGISYTPSVGNVAASSTPRGFLSSLFGGGKLTNFINGTQKTLNIINQAIPLVRQVSPVMKNAKTMFKVMNEFKKVDNSNKQNNIPITTLNSSTNINTTEENIQGVANNTNRPTFFL